MNIYKNETNKKYNNNKEYCLLIVPNLLYMMVQFVINYSAITENLNNK